MDAVLTCEVELQKQDRTSYAAELHATIRARYGCVVVADDLEARPWLLLATHAAWVGGVCLLAALCQYPPKVSNPRLAPSPFAHVRFEPRGGQRAR